MRTDVSRWLHWWERAALGALGVVVLYVTAAVAVFAWRHPHLTDREVLLHIGDALTWREVTQ